ncbi:hypothetical protein SS50377_27399 [Spironucleus salmonicida]|uniref:Uncharacterized protein n=1 Tax=Spironucleus salmonicida TaxID=348837 RepID=A0A9P8RVS6_9EUKA|nr:hypothetical protein SS50377_27399 [Spironucleus salmonicida]
MDLAQYEYSAPESIKDSFTVSQGSSYISSSSADDDCRSLYINIKQSYKNLVDLMLKFSNIQSTIDSFDDQFMEVAKEQFNTVQLISQQNSTQ